jgi:hypothetical protein
MTESKLYVQTFDLVVWLLRHIDGSLPVGAALHRDAMSLLDHVVLALKGIDRRIHLDEADATNALLRVRLQLALEVAIIDERRLLYLTRELDEIGRQLGGWLRHLGGEMERHR